jgi:acetolactate synthase I/II/III large subunit
MKLSDALVTTLQNWGVRSVFGVSGANIEHFHDSIHRLGGDTLKSVLARTEMGAAFMADSNARVHRTLGVCCSTSGGGMMNLAVGIAESFNDSVPVLAIVGQPPKILEGCGAFQDSSGIGRSVDALALWNAITKYTARIEQPSDFWPCLEKAVRLALSGRPGPVALLIPRDLNESEVGDVPDSILELLNNRPTLVPKFEDILSLDLMIRQAKNPVMIIGSGMRRASHPNVARDYAIGAKIPVVTTMADPAAFPNGHPLYLGMVGVAGHPSAHRYLNEEADLIIAVGTGFNIMARAPIAMGLGRAKVAVVNIDVEKILNAITPALTVKADASPTFNALIARWRAEPFYASAVMNYKLTRFVAELDPPSQKKSEEYDRDSVLLQSEALSILQSHLPANGHLIFDAGNCTASALHYLAMPKGSSATIALGMGGMGYSIPAAIGAQISSSNKTQTTVICGDGAFLMLGLEVHTAVELGLPILFIVFNNNKHGMCVTRQQLFFEGRTEATEYQGIQIKDVARGLAGSDQLWAQTASTGAELEKALEDFRNQNFTKPGILELQLPLEELPPFSPFLPKEAKTYEVSSCEMAA